MEYGIVMTVPFPSSLGIERGCALSRKFRIITQSSSTAHQLPGEHGEILGRKCLFNTYAHNIWLN